MSTKLPRTEPSPLEGLKPSEVRVLEALQSLGFDEIVHTGWPDFAVWNHGQLFFVEVKSGKDSIKPKQRICHEFLRSKGFAVITIQADGTYSQIKNRLRYWTPEEDLSIYYGVGC